MGECISAFSKAEPVAHVPFLVLLVLYLCLNCCIKLRLLCGFNHFTTVLCEQLYTFSLFFSF